MKPGASASYANPRETLHFVSALLLRNMRAGSSTVVERLLTPDASSIVKQAASLAHRRGHTQVTPFHVAVTMLSVPRGLLRSACLRSHSQSHPLRCRALDLCLNVALNRLPSSSQTLAGCCRSRRSPSLSNSLVATFKRAQAHRRRGPEQQPLIAVRIDVKQLIMSILDDPSISRVMKEAGFSSIRVKSFVEKANTNPIAGEPMHGGNMTRNEDMITAVSLDLSLSCDSNLYSQPGSKGSGEDGEIRNELASSLDVSANTAIINHRASAFSPWLLQRREESRRATISDAAVSHRVSHDRPSQNSMLNSGSSSHYDLNSSSSTKTIEADYHPKFTELNAENLKTLCASLERVTHQKEIICNIASALLQCRSRMVKRKERSGSPDFIKEETWLFFLGADAEGKERVARALAGLIFGSPTCFVSIGLDEFPSSGDRRSKRSRPGSCKGYLDRLVHEIQDNPHRVIVLEDVEKVDYRSRMEILSAITSGMVRRSSGGEDVSVSDAVVILSCGSFDTRSTACYRPAKHRFDSGGGGGAGFDLNSHSECGEVDWSFDDAGLLEAVDGAVVFKCPDEL